METEKQIVAKGKDMEKQCKKQYQTPQLIIHGTIQKITGNVGFKGSDTRAGSSV
jgi:hypothetical protein